MNNLQKLRLQMETNPTYALVIPLLIFALTVAFFLTLIDIFIYLLVAVAGISVASLLIVSKKTDYWWYYAYDDNKWGQQRTLIQKLETVHKKG